jgi:hypothetical protein
MAPEEKQILLVDLCARLPYGVSLQLNSWEKETIKCRLTGIDEDGNLTADVPADCAFIIEDVKPYLRPMSSMTDEEKEHLQALHNIISDENYGDGYSPAAWDAISEFNDYCHAHHLDNRGLIGKGLALETPEHMYD